MITLSHASTFFYAVRRARSDMELLFYSIDYMVNVRITEDGYCVFHASGFLTSVIELYY